MNEKQLGKRKITRKLALKRETIRILENRVLGDLNGGLILYPPMPMSYDCSLGQCTHGGSCVTCKTWSPSCAQCG